MHLLTLDEVAERLRISPHTVVRRRAEGVPFFADQAVRIGRSIRWRNVDLDNYIANLPYA